MAIACVRGLVRTRDMGKVESHSHPWHVDIQVGMCIFSLDVCVFDHVMSTKVGSNPCRRLSLLGFAHPVVGSPFQVQVQCRRLTCMWDESRTRLCFVLFLSCIIFEQNKNMHTFLGIKGTIK